MNYNNRIIHFNLLKGNTYLYDSVTLESVIKFTTYCQQNKDHYAKLMLILIKTNLQTDDTQLIDITFKISEKKMIETTFRKTATIFHDRLDEFFKHKQQTPGSTPPTRLEQLAHGGFKKKDKKQKGGTMNERIILMIISYLKQIMLIPFYLLKSNPSIAQNINVSLTESQLIPPPPSEHLQAMGLLQPQPPLPLPLPLPPLQPQPFSPTLSLVEMDDTDEAVIDKIDQDDRRHVYVGVHVLGFETDERHGGFCTIKILKDIDYDENYRNEIRVYETLFTNVTQFIKDNVCNFYGSGERGDAIYINFNYPDQSKVIKITGWALPGFSDVGGNLYFVTEFNPAYETLHNLLKNSKHTDLNTPFQNCVSTLQTVNTYYNFFHGDLHAENILIDRQNNSVKLFDFDWSGFCKSDSDCQMTTLMTNAFVKTTEFDRLLHTEKNQKLHFFDVYRLFTSIVHSFQIKPDTLGTYYEKLYDCTNKELTRYQKEQDSLPMPECPLYQPNFRVPVWNEEMHYYTTWTNIYDCWFTTQKTQNGGRRKRNKKPKTTVVQINGVKYSRKETTKDKYDLYNKKTASEKKRLKTIIKKYKHTFFVYKKLL